MFKIILVALLLSLTANAGLPPTTIKGQSDTTQPTTFNLQVPQFQSTRVGSTTALIETGNTNLLANPSFEGSAIGSAWVAGSGVVASVSTSTFVVPGKQSALLTLTATNGAALSQAAAAPSYVANFQASAWVKTSLTTVQVCSYLGAVVQQCVSAPSDGLWHQLIAGVVTDGTSAPSLVIQTTGASTGTLNVDAAYLGVNQNIANVSQGYMFGTATQVGGTSGCNFVETTSTSITNFVDLGTGTCSNAWVVTGGVTATSTNSSQILATNLPAGEAIITISGILFDDTANQGCVFQITDGTTGFGSSAIRTTGAIIGSTIVGRINYSTAGNHTFKVQAADDGAGACYLINDQTSPRLTWMIQSLPSSQQTVYNPASSAQAWAGYHDNTCSWARTNTAYGDPTADTTCNLVQRSNSNFGTVTTYGGASALPGLVFTPSSTGLFYVCAAPKVTAASLGAIMDLRLYDITSSVELGTAEESAFVSADQQFLPICGIISVTSGVPKTVALQTKSTAGSVTIAVNSTNASAVDWTIYNLTQGMSMPLLANQVVSSSNGVEVMNRAKITGSATTPVVSSQSGSWASAVSRSSTGNYTLTVSGYSAAPSCTCRCGDPGSGAFCEFVSATTSTSVNVVCVLSNGSGGADVDREVICQGPK